MVKQITVTVVYGGKSAEHEVSKLSAKNVLAAIDQSKYQTKEVYIPIDGEWTKEMLEGIKNSDVVFPVLHGPYGEDGSIQGLLKTLGVPFVGSDVLGSAIGMDKDVMKRLCRDANISVAPWITIRRDQVVPYDAIEKLGLPLFVKPANMGSSIGVDKVHQVEELDKAIQNAFLYDTKVLVEAFVSGDIVECSIVGSRNPQASVPGIVRPIGHEFYSYEAKYLDEDGYELQIPAKLSSHMISRIQEISLQVFKICECDGMARIDSFLTTEGEIIVNEINTIPGFTNISMYPKLWEASGITYNELVTTLIELALERHKRTKALKTSRI